METAPAASTRRHSTRRGFLRAAGVAALAGGAAAGGYFAARDCVRVGLVGAGTRGEALAEIIRKTGYYMYRHGRVVAVADVNLPRAAALQEKHAPWADVFADHRPLIERGDIDAVIVACADHWHAAIAIEAMRAGKAVYLEKPMAQTIRESFDVVRVAGETKARILIGTQQRSDARFRTAAELAVNGRLGKITKARVLVGVKELEVGPFPVVPVPEGLDWDRWLGPAPAASYAKERYEGWHYFWDYGGGEPTNWGIHHLDCALWSLGLDNVLPAVVRGSSPDLPSRPGGYECPARFEMQLEYPNGTVVEVVSDEREKRDESGLFLIGDEGEIFVSRTELRGEPAAALAANPLPADARRMHPNPATMRRTTVTHLCHFWDVVRGSATPVSSVDSCHHANVALHMGNIAMRVGKPLRWDARVQAFPGEAAANAMIDPPRRKGFELPA